MARRHQRARCRVLSAAVVILVAGTAALADESPVADALRTAVATGQVEGMAAPNASERAALRVLYEPAAYAPLWLDDERPTAQALETIAVLGEAETHGLELRDYAVAWLGEAARRGAVDAPDRARFDATLSLALLRLLAHLHVGRVSPTDLRFAYDVEPKREDLPALVYRAVAHGDVRAMVEQAEPPFAQTHLLERQLARYRALALDPYVEPPVLVPTIRPGDALPKASALARWLLALGDLAPAPPPPVSTYDDVLVGAVQRFQVRHGLEPDGVIGARTARALAVPASARVEQIRLALERLRWIPTLPSGRVVVVNVPAFELLAFDEIGTGVPPALQLGVVVGRALRTQTPVFTGVMRTVVFAPYWNVPTGILRNEILPKLRRDPAYLAREDMEIVSAGRVVAPTAAALAELARGTAQVRQRPGPKNALGAVKFLFPNANDVYLHDTPARSLFRQARRDFSHGCIRVSDAAALARWVLAGEGWDGGRVDRTLASGERLSVPLTNPIPVVVAYTTAVARRDGTVSFYDDIYGHDAALARVLAERER